MVNIYETKVLSLLKEENYYDAYLLFVDKDIGLSKSIVQMISKENNSLYFLFSAIKRCKIIETGIDEVLKEKGFSELEIDIIFLYGNHLDLVSSKTLEEYKVDSCLEDFSLKKAQETNSSILWAFFDGYASDIKLLSVSRLEALENYYPKTFAFYKEFIRDFKDFDEKQLQTLTSIFTNLLKETRKMPKRGVSRKTLDIILD